MADDIQIKALGSDPNQQSSPSTNTGNSNSGGQTTGTQSGTQTGQAAQAGQAATQTTGQVAGQSTVQNSTVQNPTQASTGQIPSTQATSTQIADQTTSVTPPKAPSKKAFNLADELDEDNTTQTPPEKYAIPSIVKEKFPDLVDLIKTTESMSDDEREYWFQILPIMTEEQIKKFRDILVNEKDQLAKLDSEYEEELNRLNEKHMIEWKEFESKEKRRALTQAEQQAESSEKQTEEDLLAKLSQI